MRLLNKEEKELCKRILEGDGNNNFIGNLLYSKLSGVTISVTRETQEVKVLIDRKSDDPSEVLKNDMPRIKEITVLLLNVVNLIKLLEKENYIMLLQVSSTPSNKTTTFGQGIADSVKTCMEFPDPAISELLIEYVDKEIFVTEEFRQFCANKYISRDEQRFRKQISKTNFALSLTIIALFINTSLSVFPLLTGKEKNRRVQTDSLKLELEQIKSLIENFKKQSNQNAVKLSEELTKLDATRTNYKAKE
ncbi:hypothetical protein PbJCM13498_38950 [Prolixibacter bellariivorans]|uniref:Uncharacterized protein n=1 Tax=Prolixibacter bellariivorans TaxID=314319 RepID=A0A5M4B4F0_9BACT|nr:hypothetical protein [Prolixibacter bellariivorans]GET35032.1 hypothetical protein PbJCM13498_38950 [Prolixibacter bellariivorans]